MEPDRYRDWLDRLASWGREHPDVVGVVALGSTAGVDRQPDEHSDHDVWIVTRDGAAAGLRGDLSWLPDADRIVMTHVETQHGRGVVYDDGHLVELAVFDDHELEVAQANVHRVLVDRGDVTARLEQMVERTARVVAASDPDGSRRFHAVVVQLITGLGRQARGEHLSAHQRIRGFALTALLGLLADHLPGERADVLDGLDPHRRFEQAHPELAARIAAALERPVRDTAAELLAIAEEHLSGRVEAARPEVFAAVRSVIARTGPVGDLPPGPSPRP